MFLMGRFSKDKNPRFRFVPITVKIEHGSLCERSDKNCGNLGLRSPKNDLRVSFKVLP